MSKFVFSTRSEKNMQGVHPDLVKVTRRALELTDVDFMVIEGKRNEARQRQLVINGKSRTMNSRHLTGHAVDCAPIVNGSIPWQEWSYFKKVAEVMIQAGKEFGIDVEWGGNWDSFKDGPHFQLTWKSYPA